MRSRCFRTKFRSFCLAFFTFPVGVAGGMAGALADRGVAGIERARERGGGGVSTELRGVVAGLRSSSRRAGILVSVLLLCVNVLGCWRRCVRGGRVARRSVMLGQPPLVAVRLISSSAAHSKQLGELVRHLTGPGSLASNLGSVLGLWAPERGGLGVFAKSEKPKSGFKQNLSV